MSERKISALLSALEAADVDIGGNNVVSADIIKEIAMKKIKENADVKVVGGRRHLAKMLLAAVIFVLVLSIGAGAYMGLSRHADPAAVFGGFFEQQGYSKGEHIVEYEKVEIDGEIYEKLVANMPAWERMPADKAVAEKYIYPYVYGVGESLVWEDYILTVEAVLYDDAADCGLLYYTVENPNGVEGYNIWVNGEINWSSDSPYYVALTQGERSYIDESRTTDTKVYVCAYFVNTEEDDYMSIRLGNGAEKLRDECVEMSVALPEVKLEHWSLDGGNVVLTPIGMKIDKKALGLSLTNDIDHITLRFADGSEYIVEQDDGEAYISNRAYACENSNGSISRTLFNSVVDIADVREVEIEGSCFKIE